MTLTLRHPISCDAATFWRYFLDDESAVKLYLDALGATSAAVTEREGEYPNAVTRTLVAEQPVEAPGPIKKIFGTTQRTTEIGAFDPQGVVWSFRLEPSTMADKVSVRGSIHVVDEPDGTITRVTDLDIDVKIFGVGKAVARFIESQTRDRQNAAAAYLNATLG